MIKQRVGAARVKEGGEVNLPKRDVIATCLVAAAGVLYLLWAAGSSPPGMSGARASGALILALGFAASAIAVVPSSPSCYTATGSISRSRPSSAWVRPSAEC